MNPHGQSVLQARRLVEAGVPLVTVFWPNDGITNVSVYWDTHSRNFIDLKTRLCPVTDRAFSALLDDLKDRGLLDDTLVVWTGEMGRTPKVGQSVPGGAGAGRDGRDHWGKVFTSILAGGGVKRRSGLRRERPVRGRTGREPDAAGRSRRHDLSPARRRSAPDHPRPPRPPDDAVRGEGHRGDCVDLTDHFASKYRSAYFRNVGQFGPVVWPPACWRKAISPSTSAVSCLGNSLVPRSLLAQQLVHRVGRGRRP